MNAEKLTFREVLDATPNTELAASPADAMDLAKLDLEAIALAQFRKSEEALKTAKETLTGVVLDLSTATKLNDAKSLRQRLINAPLADARKLNTGLKSKLAAVSKAIGGKLTEIEEGFNAADKLITPQIEAREAEIAEEKRIAAEKEAERVAAIQVRIDAITASVVRAQAPEMTAERILKGIGLIEAIAIDDSFAEFKAEAEGAKATTLAAMRNLAAIAKAREDEAARVEAQRLENERIAAEQAAAAERLAEQQRALEAQAAALAAQQKAIDDAKAEEAARLAADAKVWAEREAEASAFEAWAKTARPSGDVESVQRQWEASPEYHDHFGIEYTPAQTPQQVLKAEPEKAEATDRGVSATTSPSVGSMGAGKAADAAPSCLTCSDIGLVGSAAQMDAVDCPDCTPAPVAAVRTIHPAAQSFRNETPTLKLGTICERLGFTVTADFLASLGFEAQVERNSKLYRESEFRNICNALNRHIDEVAADAVMAA